MEHLPLPQNPTIGTIAVPFTCTEQYDGGPFKEYPKRHGVVIESYSRRITFKRDGQYILDPTEIAALLQTWLYFGLLCEFTTKNSDYSQFVKLSATADSRLLSSAPLPDIVGRRSVEIVESDWAQDSSQLEKWKVHIYSCLFEVGEIVGTIAVFCEMHPDTVLSPVSLSIAALAEYLMRVVRDVCKVKSHPLVNDILFRSGHGDVSAPVLRIMREKGWCPNHMAFFENQEASTIGMLWYYANIEPPQPSGAHKDCTVKQCQVLQVDERFYRTSHMTERCDCQFLGLNPEKLAEKVRSDVLPLFNIPKSNASDIELELSSPSDEECETEFVAISHVWADGFGNPSENKLPTCVLRYIQGVANSLPRKAPQKSMKIWMDTICLPVGPRELRHQALTKMNDPYRNATFVIVLDRYLRKLDIEHMSPGDIFARIVVSGWHQRLWTFAEGRLAKRAVFAFKRQLEELQAVVTPYRENFRSIPSVPSTYVESNVISSYQASRVFDMSENSRYHVKQIPALRAALSTRATSRASDEALCLGLILGLDLNPILQADDREKMAEIWKSFEKIPVGLVFSKVLPKMSRKGYRWAPSSIMTTTDNTRWGGLTVLFLELGAQPVAEGLRFRQPSIFWRVNPSNSTTEAKRRLLEICNPLDPKAGKLDLWLKDEQGRFFIVAIDEVWHQDLFKIELEKEMPAIIVTTAVQQTTTQRKFEDAKQAYQYGTRRFGVLVTFNKSQADAPEVQARVHRHVRIQMLSDQASKEFEGLEKCAEKMCAEYPNVVEQIQGLSMNTDASYPTHFTDFVENYARTQGLLELGKLTSAFVQLPQTDEAVLRKFNIIVRYFVSLRDWIQIAENPSPVTWVID